LIILFKNSISRNERSMFLIIGDKGRDQISNLHNFYSQLNPGKKLSILWCYKNELGFSNHARKKMKKIKKQMNKGVFELNDENAFDLFISTADIKFCYYHDTQRILGTTFGMLILQDFEAITPNLLCRTIETVQGGGVIIFLLSNMTSLKQLYTLSMDVHDRYRTEKNKDIEPRFNERFILSLTSCKNVLAVDDELNLLPITDNMKNMTIQEKSIDESEFKMFLEIAGEYFIHMSEYLFHQMPSLLMKILGVYRIRIKKEDENHKEKEENFYLMMMENLNYGLDVTKGRLNSYDLKGSEANRYINKESVKGKENVVLHDNNFKEDFNNEPIPINKTIYDLLIISVHNDTVFLSKIGVVDYSLLLHIYHDDKQKKTLS